MKSLRILIPAAVLALADLAAAAPANIDALVEARGADYVALRDAALARPDLKAWLAAQPADGWRRAVLVEALALRADTPQIDAPLRHLRGLDPAVYLQNRRPEPVAGRELAAARVPAAILMECYWKTVDRVSLHDGGYPDGLSPERVDALAAAEHLAFRSALLMAIGRSGHALAAPFLANAARDDTAPVAARSLAATAIGDTQSRAAAGLLRDLLGRVAPPIRAGVVHGAGKLRNEDGLDLMMQTLADFDDPGVRQVALMSLGAYANARTWGGVRDGDAAHQAHLREAAAMLLVDSVSAPWAPAVRDSLVQALAATQHASVAPALRALESSPNASKTAREIAAQALALLEIHATRVP